MFYLTRDRNIVHACMHAYTYIGTYVTGDTISLLLFEFGIHTDTHTILIFKKY